MSAKRVLVVDDEPDVRSMYSDVLADAGFDVMAASSGEECLKTLNAADGRFDLVLLDVLLPEQTGYDVLDVIRAAWSELPVVLVSGKVDKLTRNALDALGAAEFLEKPVAPEVLVETVKRHARR